ncbi:uncharacterized protein TRIADDRAFT_55874 [Trichoplax adhaerens]|uniref:G-protein coupled receptors family 1 profile domain-containing protein n=1 Tax=Trichoplax adhaerens TaxID=10228 RepID=B3RW39_TRIAD|nr:hypothetical protein TRIADDRAFT_55874 [Trichoplax adhaerens]EDV25602.1 hypothetical protein TRIADDRAFT_55874 [Trichoplax adhaerens]|eukprot:XP_002111635.1 hypothetical protein TRIADDRAFT_55874 [Trichoplax adhaerens]
MATNATITAIPVKSESISVATANILYAIFASLSILDNILICWLFLRNSQLLRLASSILIFSLAIIDILTGILIMATPKTYGGIQIHLQGVDAVLYCTLVYSEYFIWTLGIASCYIIAALSVERLYMVSAAAMYKYVFTPTKTILYVILIILWAGILNAPNFYHFYHNENITNPVPCGFRILAVDETASRAIYFTSFALRFAIPLVITITCYVGFMRKIRTAITCISSANNVQTGKRSRLMLRRLTRMCVLISIAFCICWLPNQVYFVLRAQRLIKHNLAFHMFTKVLVSMNSAINLFIYTASNLYFYNELIALIKFICCCKRVQRKIGFLSA